MAIGAQRADILSMMLREAGLLVGLGLITGLAASLAGADPSQPALRHRRRAIR
jgi:ABC-type antimicrobial peptide transport system permease subunit